MSEKDTFTFPSATSSGGNSGIISPKKLVLRLSLNVAVLWLRYLASALSGAPALSDIFRKIFSGIVRKDRDSLLISEFASWLSNPASIFR